MKQLSEDTQDYLRVLNEIGKVSKEDLDGDNSERALFEVQEYARMGALLVREEFKIAQASGENTGNLDSTAQRSLH